MRARLSAQLAHCGWCIPFLYNVTCFSSLENCCVFICEKMVFELKQIVTLKCLCEYSVQSVGYSVVQSGFMFIRFVKVKSVFLKR